MSTSEATYTLVGGRQTDGTWLHTGKLIVTAVTPNGATLKVTLPDDWLSSLSGLDTRVTALETRVTALEAAVANMPNSIEDLKYGG